MAIHSSSLFAHMALLTILALFLNANTCSAVKPAHGAGNRDFVQSSCKSTKYPSLCFSSLSSFAGVIQRSPMQMADAALSVSLSNVRATTDVIGKMVKGSRGMNSREAEAMADCMDTMGASVEELQMSLRAMGHLRGKDFRLRVNDIQTWVSSALTDENTCMDDFATSSVGRGEQAAIRGRIVKVAQLTSNALALVNALANV